MSFQSAMVCKLQREPPPSQKTLTPNSPPTDRIWPEVRVPKLSPRSCSHWLTGVPQQPGNEWVCDSPKVPHEQMRPSIRSQVLSYTPLTCGHCPLCSARVSPSQVCQVRFLKPDVSGGLMCLVIPVGCKMPGAGVLTSLLWPKPPPYLSRSPRNKEAHRTPGR